MTRPIIHGESGNLLYSKWNSMNQRCYNKKHKRYKDWGYRGIKVCDEWKNDIHSFFTWALANGYQKGLQIDRIDNDGDYKPSNCRFVTRKENGRNKRNNVLLTYNGETRCFTDWCEKIGIGIKSLKYRIKSWGLERALSTPVAANRKYSNDNK